MPIAYKRSLLVLIGSIPALNLSITTSQAQETPRYTLEEVIVTAQKREESLQDTPISLVAFSEADVERLRITNLHDISHDVPNLDIRQTTNSSAGARISIRGVGVNDHVLTLDGAVGMYMDGVYIARNTGLAFEMADLERVEVLRGPQGSLWGRNTTGGAISLISKKPTGELAFKQTVDIGNYDYIRSNTQLDVPITKSLAAKISLLYQEHGGWVDNNGAGHDFGEDRDKGARLALRWTPSDSLIVDYAYDYAESKFSSAYYQNAAPFNEQFSAVPYFEDRQEEASSSHYYESSNFDIDGHSLTLEWAINEQLTLRSISAYREMHQHNYTDNGANPITPRLFSNDPFDVDQYQFSQEVQLLGSAFDDALQYTAGLYYFTESGSEYNADYITLGGIPVVNYIEIQAYSRDLKARNSAAAAYGQATWTPGILDQRLHLTAGFRYSADEREIDYKQPGVDAQNKDDWNNLSPTAIVAYDFAESSNVYLKYVEGYRTGGFNGRAANQRGAMVPVDEEQLASLELGFKSEWFQQRLRANAALFYSRYNDIQLSLFDVDGPPGSVLRINAGKANIQGVELDIAAALTRGLELRFAYAYLKHKFDEVIDPETGEDIADDFLVVGAPSNSYNVDLEYRFEPCSWGEFSADLNYAWRDTREIGTNVQDAGDALKAYGLWNARLSLANIPVSPKNQFGINLWAKNLTNEDIQMDAFKVPTTGGTFMNYGTPRTYGVQLVYTFN